MGLKTKHTTGSSSQYVVHVLFIFIVTRLLCESLRKDMKINNFKLFIVSFFQNIYIYICTLQSMGFNTLFCRWVEVVYKPDN